MKTTPFDIRRQEFQKTFRGFDPADVRSFLERVASEWEGLLAENKSLEQKSAELESQLREFRAMERGFQHTIVQAQEASSNALDSARKEAQLVIREAEMKAVLIVEKARTDLLLLREQLTILGAKKDSISSRLKALLHSELELIEALEADDELRKAAATGERRELSSERLEIEDIIRSLDR